MIKTENGSLIEAQAGRFKGWHVDIELETGHMLLTKQRVDGAYWRINRIVKRKPAGGK